MLTETMIKRAKEAAKKDIPADELVDARDVHIDMEEPIEQRIRSYVKQIKNPYIYKVGKVVVRVEFSGDRSLDELLESYVREHA